MARKPKKDARATQAAAVPAAGKPVRASQAEYVEVVLPSQANPLGNVLGGHVMHLMDITAAIAAHRHSNSYAATVAGDGGGQPKRGRPVVPETLDERRRYREAAVRRKLRLAHRYKRAPAGRES